MSETQPDPAPPAETRTVAGDFLLWPDFDAAAEAEQRIALNMRAGGTTPFSQVQPVQTTDGRWALFRPDPTERNSPWMRDVAGYEEASEIELPVNRAEPGMHVPREVPKSYAKVVMTKVAGAAPNTTFWDDVDTFITTNTGPMTQIIWEESTELARGSPVLAAIARARGTPSQQIDQMFVLADRYAAGRPVA